MYNQKFFYIFIGNNHPDILNGGKKEGSENYYIEYSVIIMIEKSKMYFFVYT